MWAADEAGGARHFDSQRSYLLSSEGRVEAATETFPASRSKVSLALAMIFLLSFRPSRV